MANREEMITGIRKAAIAANPEIVELKFGCHYRVRKGGMIHTLRKDFMEAGYCGECREGHLSGAAFRGYRCGYCKKGFSHPNTGTPKYCLPCANTHGKCRYCGCHLEIIGRPMRLADVLLAMSARSGDESGRIWIDEYGHVKCGEWVTNILWNLRADDLDRQSDDTVQFIFNLLIV